MTRETVLSERRGAATWITLNRPERRNALDSGMVSELHRTIEEARTDDSTRVIVLAGAGEVFCAGADLGGHASPTPARAPSRDYSDLLLLLSRLDKPTVARVHGAALGGGLGLAVSCDVVLVARDTKLGTPEIDVGLFPMMVMAVLLRHAPRRRILEMMLTGGRIDGATAADWGLATRAVAADELDPELERVVSAIASKSPATIRLGLEAYRCQEGMPLAEALPYLRGMLERVLATEDAHEGIRAFLEKRAPVWKGR